VRCLVRMIFFIIVYGSYGITYSKGPPGEFHCPCCSGTRGYRHRRVRRFFHVFFIPLIPLNLAGEYVECAGCKGTYKLEVLEASKALISGMAAGMAQAPGQGPSLSEGQKAARRVLAMMTLADGRVEEAEIVAMLDYLRFAEKRSVTRDEVLAELEAARTAPADVETFCRQIMGFLNEQGRQDVLKAAHMVASADGHVDPSEQKLLERLGIALGMKPAQVSSNLAATPQPMQQQQQGVQQQAQRTPFCPTCGAQARFFPDQQAWGCDHCRAMLPR
jgi:tellurite resistance protein